MSRTSDQKPNDPPRLSSIIVSHNAGNDLDRCVASILGQSDVIEVIVVDNGSMDGSVDRVRRDHPEVRVVSNGLNDGYAGGANRGASAATANVLLFLNADIVLEPGCVDALLDALAAPGGAICAPLVVASDGGLVEYGFTVDWAGDLIGLTAPGLSLYVSGCALATTRSVFTALGGFDAEYFMFCEDLDLCWRALLSGYEVRVTPEARVRHRGGASTPGGYVRDGRVEVTSFRIALRERNTLATLVRCAPAGWAALVILFRLARLIGIAIVAVISGRPRLAVELALGVTWNIRRLPRLYSERRRMNVSAQSRRRVLKERVRRDIVSWRVLLRHGLPHFVDR